MAGRVTIDQFKSQLGRPSLTSKYYLELAIPRNDGEFRSLLQKRGIQLTATDQSNLNLYCSEASLPGSSLALIDIASDRTGVTERHAHRRVFDDRIDLTFYVDGDNYTVIKYFETWIDFISGSGTTQDFVTANRNEKLNENYFYRMNYPDEYTCSGFKVTKFESDSFRNINPTGGSLVYNFVKAFPISINSMPISYEASQLLKCTVSMTYVRYVIERTKAQTPVAEKTPQPKVPAPKDGSAAADQFFNDNRRSLLNDKNGSTFNFDPSKFGGGKPVNPNVNSNIA